MSAVTNNTDARDRVVRWLEEHGISAEAVASKWEGEPEGDALDAEDTMAGTDDGSSQPAAPGETLPSSDAASNAANGDAPQ